MARVGNIRRAGGGEVAFVRVVRALLVVDALDQLGDQKVDVAVALAMAMRRHVHGQTVDARGEIGAVVEVEAAEKILVRLTVAAVLSDDEARHDFEYLTRAKQRTILQLRGEHGADARGVGVRESLDAPGGNGDLFDELAGLSRRPRSQGTRNRYPVHWRNAPGGTSFASWRSRSIRAGAYDGFRECHTGYEYIYSKRVISFHALRRGSSGLPCMKLLLSLIRGRFSLETQAYHSLVIIGSAATASLAFVLGLRHGLDADHLAAIDGLTRCHASAKNRFAPFCGVLFSAGHAGVILFVAIALAALAGRWDPPGWLGIRGHADLGGNAAITRFAEPACGTVGALGVRVALR